MAYDGSGSLFALGVRLTRLDAAGAPLVGPGNAYTTKSLVRIGIGEEFSEPDAIEQINGSGETCVYYQPKPSLLRGTIEEFSFCTPDPYVKQFLTGGELITTGGTQEVQTITVTGAPTGGFFTLTALGETTDPIAWGVSGPTSAAIESALEDLNALGTADVAVTGSAGGPYTVTFGTAQTASNVPQMTADGTTLTGGTTPTVTVTTTTQGLEGSTVIGYRAPAVNTDPVPNGVGLEFWTRKMLNNSFAGYWHWILPRVNVHLSDPMEATAEDALLPTFEGSAEQNPGFGDGPENDITIPADRIYQYYSENVIPDLTRGPVAVIADA